MIRIIRVLLLFLLLVVQSNGVGFAQMQAPFEPQTIPVNQEHPFAADIAPASLYLLERDNRLSLAQARQSQGWQPTGVETITGFNLIPDDDRSFQDYGGKIFPTWLHFKLHNPSNRDGTWRVDTQMIGFRQIDITLIRADGTFEPRLSLSAGNSINDRPVNHRFVATDIDLAAEETVDVFIRYVGVNTHAMDAKVANIETFGIVYSARAVWEALFVGAISTILFLALISSYITGWRISGVFCGYMIVGTLFALSDSGTFYQTFLANDFLLAFNLREVFLMLTVCGILLLGRLLFDLQDINARYDQFVLVVVGLTAMTAVLLVFVEMGANFWFDMFAFLLGPLALVLHTVNAAIARAHNRKGATVILGSGLFIAFTAILFNFGPSSWHDTVDQTGMIRIWAIIEACAFATAMVQRSHGIKSELDQAVATELASTKERLRLSTQLRDSEQAYRSVQRQSDRRKAQLASVSHDILQPLTALRTALSDVPDKNPDRAENMHNAFTYLETLARDSLNAGLTSEEDETASLETFPLSAVLDNVAAMFRAEADAKGLSLEYFPPDVTVASDPVALMRIISNIVSNAVKHCSAGTVDLYTTQTATGVDIIVSDTGPGMTEQELAANKTPQHKGPESTGNGLGLGLVIRMCEDLGHKLHIQSSVENGTIVTISVAILDETNIRKTRKSK